jgi:hypothetical protein
MSGIYEGARILASQDFYFNLHDPSSFALKMEAEYSSETTELTYYPTICKDPADYHISLVFWIVFTLWHLVELICFL